MNGIDHTVNDMDRNIGQMDREWRYTDTTFSANHRIASSNCENDGIILDLSQKTQGSKNTVPVVTPTLQPLATMPNGVGVKNNNSHLLSPKSTKREILQKIRANILRKRRLQSIIGRI